MARLTTIQEDYNIENTILENMKKRIPNLYLGEDSMVGILSEAVALEIGAITEEAKRIYYNNQLSNASGSILDEIAFKEYGLSRYPETYASSLKAERNVYFYSEAPTLGDVNGGQGFVIPAGTIISNEIDVDNAEIQFELIEDVTIFADEPFAFASIRAVNTGSAYNVDTSILVYHNFTGYSGYLNDELLIENRFPIINGSEKETDSNFKFRLTSYFESSLNKNQEYLLMQGLSLPGVYDVSVIPSYHGIGTTGVVLFGAGREASSQMESLIEIRLSEAKTPGQEIIVSHGIEIYIDLNIRAYYQKGINTLELEKIKRSAILEIKENIKEKERSGVINFIEISNIVKNNFKNKDFRGFGNSGSSIFESIYIRRSDKYNEFPEERKTFEGNFLTIQEDERVRFGIVNLILEEDNR